MTVSAITGLGLGDRSVQAVGAALAGLAARQQAITSNIANVETPGYLAKEVRFEDSLRRAVADGDPASARVSETRSLAATRENGNNVSMDVELLAASENVLAQRLMVQALNSKYAVLRTAITGA